MEPLWITTLLGGGTVAGLVLAVKEIIIWSKNRKAQLEDREAENAIEEINKALKELKDICVANSIAITDMKKDAANQSLALVEFMGSIIDDLSRDCIIRGEILSEELSRLERLYEVYTQCGGNGARTALLKRCRLLPMAKHDEVKGEK